MKSRQKIWQRFLTVLTLVLVSSNTSSFLYPTEVFAAQTVVSEIFFDAPGSDSGNEWIEIYNNGSTTIPLTTWKLYENSSNHGISSYRGNGSIEPGEYAIIADNATKFAVTYPEYIGDIYDSVFSLNNSGETFEIRTPAGETDSIVTYGQFPGASGTGYSIHWSNGSWVVGQLSIGSGTINQSDISSQTQSGTGQVGETDTAPQNTSDQTVSKTSSAEGYYYTGSISWTPQVLVAGVPMSMLPSIEYRDSRGEGRKLRAGIHVFTLGDGTQKIFEWAEPFSHTYSVPGIYTVVYEYYTSELEQKPEIHIEKTLSVISNPIEVGTHQNLVMLKNNSGNKIDISRWIVQSGTQVLTFPQNSYIAPNSSIAIPAVIPNGNVALLSPANRILSQYPITVNSIPKNTGAKNNPLGTGTPNILSKNTTDLNRQDQVFTPNNFQSGNRYRFVRKADALPDWILIVFSIISVSIILFFVIQKVKFFRFYSKNNQNNQNGISNIQNVSGYRITEVAD